MAITKASRILAVLVSILGVAPRAQAEDFTLYAEGAYDYLVSDGEQTVLSLGPRVWLPGWRYVSFLGRSTVDEQGRRVNQDEQKHPGMAAPLALKHVARQTGPNTVELSWDLRSAADIELTLAAVGVATRGRFAEKACAVTAGDNTTRDVALPFGKGRLADAVQALTYSDAQGRKLTVRVAAACPLTTDKEARFVLAEALKANQPATLLMTVEFPGPVKFIAKDSDAFSRDDTSTWIPYSVGPTGVPFDLSFLNKDANGQFIPAGGHGFLTVKGDQFVFEDGTPGRFWGISVTAGAVLGNEARQRQLVERLSRVGVNLVRLHHLDSWDNPIIDYKHPDGTTQNLNPASMKLLDHFIFLLKQHGMHILLSPVVQRGFKAGDGVDDYGDGFGRSASGDNFGLHPYLYFDPRMQELTRKQQTDVWTHVNEYTGLAYKDDPAIVLTEVINEGLLTKLGGVRPGVYRDRLQAVYEKWAKDNGGLSWNEADVFNNNYSKNNIHFMMHLHRAFYQSGREHLRSIGVRVPMSYNNWAHWTWVLAAQSGADFMDTHLYYGGDGVGAGSGLGGNWVQHAPDQQRGPFGKFASISFPGKPVMSSELGNNPPKTYRSAYLIGMAAVAAFQGWDAMSGYAWSQYPVTYDDLGGYVWESDPLMVVSHGLGALIYRRGDVRAAKETVIVNVPQSELDKLQFEDFGRQVENLRALNAAVEEHKVLTVFPGFNADGVKPLKSYDVDAAAAYVHPSTELKSDTGELWRDWKIGVGTIDTPRTQAAYGLLGESQRVWRTAACGFDISTPFAAVALSSLDGAPIATSKRMLLATLSRAQATGQAYNMERTKIKAKGTGPILCEPVVGTLTIQTTQPALLLYPIKADGTRATAIRLPVVQGRTTVELKREYRTILYELEAAGDGE